MQTGRAPGPESTHAVGPDRVVAARLFGRALAGGRVTSYDDVVGETDLSAVRLLCLVASDGARSLLARIGTPEVLLLGATDDATGRDELLATLDARPDLRPAELSRDEGALVIRVLATTEARAARRVVRELRVLHAVRSRSLARRAAGRIRRLSR